jgi:hypothetical protein
MTQEQEEPVTKLIVFVCSKTHSAAELTAMLGLVPEESWEIGTPIGRSKRPRDASSWAIVERAVGDEYCSTAADRLVARLEAFVPRFQALPAGVEVSLRILVDEVDDVFGLGLDRPHVKFAAAIGADIDVSVRVSRSIDELERDLNARKQFP